MPIEEDRPPPHSRLQACLILTILGAAIAGWRMRRPGSRCHLQPRAVVVSDRGQHRWLAGRFRQLAPSYILSLSIARRSF